VHGFTRAADCRYHPKKSTARDPHTHFRHFEPSALAGTAGIHESAIVMEVVSPRSIVRSVSLPTLPATSAVSANRDYE
jgi:hypothetical protein